jgi:hypothetical protein
MAIEFPQPPGDTQAIAEAGVERALSGGLGPNVPPAFALAADTTEPTLLGQPHAAYNLGLEDVAAGHLTAAAEQTAWRYLVRSGDEPVAAAEVQVGAGGAGAEFSSLNHGPHVASTVQTADEAASLPQVEKGNYEPRLLRIPALYVMAMWLKDLDGSNDLIIPLAPAPPFLSAGQKYSESAFAEAVAGPAQQRLEQVGEGMA